ncbi:MAG TPA: 4-hydroxy-tetrahydrodipicolinate reductase [Anaerolineales bacterium]|nr:4-hydroxy-tetrahydrodipicolinate reductase [Anaerolineales bacterium]
MTNTSSLEKQDVIRVCLAGATGWAGSALARAIAQSDDITLVSAVSRTHAGQVLGDVLAEPRLTCPIFANAEEALAKPCDMFFEFTKPDVAKSNVLTALEGGAHVVIGTSGLTDADYDEIAAAAEGHQRGVLAVGNFALTVVLLQKFAEIAARFIPQWEIIDYAHDDKKDSPSGTVRELAYRLSKVRDSKLTVPLEQTQGVPETRGARMSGSQVHSVRLPGYTISAEVIFGMPDQKLTIRHDSGTSAQPYMDGALLAIRKVNTFVGLRRGLDSILDFERST